MWNRAKSAAQLLELRAYTNLLFNDRVDSLTTSIYTTFGSGVALERRADAHGLSAHDSYNHVLQLRSGGPSTYLTAQRDGHESQTGSQPGSFATAPVSIKIQPRHAVQHAMVLTSLTPTMSISSDSRSPRGLLFSNALPNNGNNMHDTMQTMQASI